MAIPYTIKRFTGNYTTNYNVVGSPTVTSDYVMSGFSPTDYIILPERFNPGTKTWEMVFKIKTGPSPSTSNEEFLGGSEYQEDGVEAGIRNGHFIWWLGTAPHTYNIVSGGQSTYDVLTSTIYWIRIKFTGTEYTFEYSLDGENYNLGMSVTSSNIIYGDYKAIGIDSFGPGGQWTGSIYLKESYINIDGKRWWDLRERKDYNLMVGNKYYNLERK